MTIGGPVPVLREELIRRSREARRELEELLATLSEDLMTEPGVAGDWSVKDILAHIAWYQAEEAEFYAETDIEGSPLWKTAQDERNVLLFEQNRDRPLAEVLSTFRQAHDRFMSVIETLSQNDLVTPGRFPGTSEEWPPWRKIAIHTFHHDREHISTIRDWLESSS